MRRILMCVGLGLFLLPLGGCDLFSDDSQLFPVGAAVQIKLTDAPSDLIDSAEVSISRVYLVGDGQPVDLLDPENSPQVFDLMELRGGVEALLAESPAPEGTYSQLRMVVDDATVTLVEGMTFDDGSTTQSLKVPSGSQSGLKVEIDEPIVNEDGTLTIVVVDFDVNESFVLQGNPDTPAGLKGMLFKPVLKEKRRQSQKM